VERYKKVFLICFMSIVFCLCFTLGSSAMCADADGDKVLSAGDARVVLRISVGLEPATTSVVQNCDMDYDGHLTAGDAREILRIAVGYGRSDDSGADGFEGATPVGITDKYYKIYNINGFTFIDGLLIANKTYSLPQNYAPGGLYEECETAFYTLQSAAAKDGQYMYLNSGYRSYASQQSIYTEYVYSYGYAYAEAQAARPGHSEHQTGLAIDVTNSSGYFTGSSQAAWLKENCADYGFILRYPEGKSDKTGYNAEAWHIRYVGLEHAQKITASGLCLEEYYGITSRYA